MPVPWRPVDVDADGLWADSGAAWLTGADRWVPRGLVRELCGVTGWLDERGAGIAERAGHGGLGVLTQRAALVGAAPAARGVTSGGAGRLMAASDGTMAVSLPRPEDVTLAAAWLATTVDPADPWPDVAAAMRHRRVDELVERAALVGVAAAGVGEARARADPVRALSLGAAPPTSVRDLRVINLASLWAGPLAAAVLARLGARVVTVESTGRPDGARAHPAFFAALHHRTASVGVDLRDERGRARLAALVNAADVVIEGSRPRALRQLGVDAAAVVAAGGPRVWLSITAHGRDAPFGDRIGFGDDAAAAGGLVVGADAGHGGGVGGSAVGRAGVGFVADAVADPLTGLVAAAAVVQACASGWRWLLDVALSRVAASMTADRVRLDAPLRCRAPRPWSDAPRGAELAPVGADTDQVLSEWGIEG